jgi:hypothetical protein
MTNDDKLTKDEIKRMNVRVKRDTSAVRVAGTTTLDTGEEIEATAEDLAPPAGREHGWLDVALEAIIAALEAAARELIDTGDADPEPQAK